MVLRLYAMACIVLAALLLGGSGIARAGDTDDSYSRPQSDDSYSKPDAAEQPAQSEDAAPPAEDDSAGQTDDSGGGEIAKFPHRKHDGVLKPGWTVAPNGGSSNPQRSTAT